MALAQSKVTAQWEISVPAEVRRKLGIGPGSVLEWEEEGDAVVVRKAGRYTSEDIHRAIFPRGTPASKKGDIPSKSFQTRRRRRAVAVE